MSAYQAPTVLKIPFRWLHYAQPLGYLLAETVSAPRQTIHQWVARFAFCNDEKLFVKALLRRKKNYWIFRTNQQQCCGDFAIVDMSAPSPEQRKVYVLDLKLGAPLKVGGGGAGIQFTNASQAVVAIAESTGIIDKTSNFQLLSGDRRAILAHLGVWEL